MNINMIIPPLKIQGKKTKIVPHIQELTKQLLKDNPNIDTWIEPFFGTGVVGFNVPDQITTVIVSDINPYIIEFYENIKHGVITGSSIKEWLMLMGTKLALSDENGYAFYREMREEFNKTKDIKLFLFLSRTSYNGMMRFNKKGEWNLPYCKVPEKLNEKAVTSLCEEIDKLYDLMQNKKFIFLNQSFEETLKLANDNSIIYCDPPYLGLYTNYFDTWDYKNEKQLNTTLEAIKCPKIVSTWFDNGKTKNEIIDQLWSKWNINLINHKYNVGAKVSNRRQVVEALLYK